MGIRALVILQYTQCDTIQSSRTVYIYLNFEIMEDFAEQNTRKKYLGLGWFNFLKLNK